MIFCDYNKKIAFKKAMDYWYKNLKDDVNLTNFFGRCSLKIINEKIIIEYKASTKDL